MLMPGGLMKFGWDKRGASMLLGRWSEIADLIKSRK